MPAPRFVPFPLLSQGPLFLGSDTTQLSNGRSLPARATNRRSEARASNVPFAPMPSHAPSVPMHMYASHIMPFALQAHIMKLHHHVMFMHQTMIHHMHHMQRMYHAHTVSHHVSHASHPSHPRKTCHRMPQARASHVSHDAHRKSVHHTAPVHKTAAAGKPLSQPFPFARQPGCCAKCGTDEILVYYEVYLTTEQKRGPHPYKGINICRSCRASSDYLKTVFNQLQWTIPADLRPAQCSRCCCFHTKTFFVHTKRVD